MSPLILSAALFACACAAPSGIVAPVPVAIPTIPAVAAVNSGDLQAAIIDAKVQTEDFLRSVADKQREATEQAVVDNTEKVVEVNDQAQERSIETFWAEQERKWQEYDAVQTAQAQLEGQIASTSDAVAKSLVVPAIANIVPLQSYVYGAGVNIVAQEAPKEVKPVEPAVKAALVPGIVAPEPANEGEKKEESKADSVQVESANLKTAEPKVEAKYVVAPAPLVASVPVAQLQLAQPWSQVVVPGLKTLVPFGLTPVVKTVW